MIESGVWESRVWSQRMKERRSLQGSVTAIVVKRSLGSDLTPWHLRMGIHIDREAEHHLFHPPTLDS
jgi:hypothetical protein